MPQFRMLGLFAHPDDESRIVGGTLAKYASEGVDISLLVATRGEKGSCGEPALCTPEALPRVREQELRKACSILGISNLMILDYRDGSLPDIEPGELVGCFVAAIRQVRPHVVLTFGPEGRTLHPDHLVVHEAATCAFHLAANPAAYAEQQLQAYAAPKLYYHIVPQSVAETVNWGFPSQPDSDVTITLDVRPWIDQKRKASNEAHRTQAHDLIFDGISEDKRWQLLSTEHFILAATHGIHHHEHEDDFFDDIIP